MRYGHITIFSILEQTAITYIHAVIFHHFKLFLKLIRQPLIITVLKCYEFAFSQFNASVTCGAGTRMLFKLNVSQSVISDRSDNALGFIIRAVINDNTFNIFISASLDFDFLDYNHTAADGCVWRVIQANHNALQGKVRRLVAVPAPD